MITKKRREYQKNYNKKYRQSVHGKIVIENYRNSPERREAQKRYIIKRMYGISLEQYRDMVKKQKGVCAICGEKNRRQLNVDHNHATGEIRGLLCQHVPRRPLQLYDGYDRMSY